MLDAEHEISGDLADDEDTGGGICRGHGRATTGAACEEGSWNVDRPAQDRDGRVGSTARAARASPTACAAASDPSTTWSPEATSQEVHDAALQHVRKVSAMTRPSRANAEMLERAVAQIVHATEHLLADLVTSAPPKDREVEREKARARSAKRSGTPAAS